VRCKDSGHRILNGKRPVIRSAARFGEYTAEAPMPVSRPNKDVTFAELTQGLRARFSDAWKVLWEPYAGRRASARRACRSWCWYPSRRPRLSHAGLQNACRELTTALRCDGELFETGAASARPIRYYSPSEKLLYAWERPDAVDTVPELTTLWQPHWSWRLVP